MAGPIIPNGAMISVIYDAIYLGQQIMLTLMYKAVAVSNPSVTLTDMYVGVKDAMEGGTGLDIPYAALLTPQVSSIRRHIQVIHPIRYVKRTDFSSAQNGTRASAMIPPPPNIAAVLTLRSFFTGPTEIGNKHIILTDSADAENGEISAAIRPLLELFGSFLIQNQTLGGAAAGVVLEPVIFHRAAPGASKAAELFALQPHSRIMRRRTVRQGS